MIMVVEADESTLQKVLDAIETLEEDGEIEFIQVRLRHEGEDI